MEDSGSMIDEDYEFSAPKFFDFIKGETEEEMRKVQLWFDTALSYGPSPFMPKIKTARSVQLESFCDFSEAGNRQKEQEEPSALTTALNNMNPSNLESVKEESRTSPETKHNPAESTEEVSSGKAKEEIPSGKAKEEEDTSIDVKPVCVVDEKPCEVGSCQENSALTAGGTSSTQKTKSEKRTSPGQGAEACTPKPPIPTQKKNVQQSDPKKQQTARRIASAVKNPSALKSRTVSQLSQAKSVKPASVRDASLISKVATPNLAQENQAIKRQKLEGGKSKQILSFKTQNLPHKARHGAVSDNIAPSTVKSHKEDRKMYVRDPAVLATPFVSMAEMMRKFQSGTREINLPTTSSSTLSHADAGSVIQKKPKLKLTRPKEPDFETAQRVRPVKIKSSAELEEEMMANIPKFKARPVNKRILEAPTMPALKRSMPQMPEFQEFHLETMARANHNAEASRVASTETAPQNHQWKPHLTAPKTPTLQTSLRARPPRIKSSEELEKEELEKAPKFKARPLNKKIFESKGELGLFPTAKRHITVPCEFHFATDERIPPTATDVADLFDKLSLCSETHSERQLPRNTAPNPFHLHTEERGAEKEKKFVMEVIQKQIEEERARIPVANPYPFTTDYPVVPPKPEPKQCTKPEPFQLESLVRHEEELQREMEERRRMEEEAARMRQFKAQPILKEDPLPVPEKVRKPLTEVQEFDLHVQHRAVYRAEYDKKIKEKEMMYKRYRDEAESAKMMEEEKALKQLRRTLVPHARPVPNFENPFLPQKSSRQVTKPKSPKLKILQRKERQRFACPVADATSSAASNMRKVPPKPEPKQCTKPEPFQLESLVRHEEELQREMEERRRMEEEAARMRQFKAQPILKEDPLPVPEKVRKPLTEVQEFDLHVQHRAVYRAEYDKKIKEKEMMYKRYRDEAESAKMMEEEKALKQLRRTLVPHARPVPNFENPFLPQKSSRQVTKPKSPKLKILQRKERQRFACPVADATSSAASNMR